MGLSDDVSAYRLALIREALAQHPTHSAAARALGIRRTYLLRLIRQHGLSTKVGILPEALPVAP